MTRFEVHTQQSAPGKSKEILYRVSKKYGFIPNLAASLAESPALLEGYTTLSGIFSQTNLTETERQIILMTNNRLNDCRYCMAAHTSIAKAGQVPDEFITALRAGTSLSDPKLEALRRFTEKVHQSQGRPDQTDIMELMEFGYTKETVLEVILGTALKVLSNYTTHTAKTPIDAEFVPYAWEG